MAGQRSWEDELKTFNNDFAVGAAAAAAAVPVPPEPPKQKRGSFFRIPLRSKSATASPRAQSVSTETSSIGSDLQSISTTTTTTTTTTTATPLTRRRKLQKRVKEGSTKKPSSGLNKQTSNGYYYDDDNPRVRLGGGDGYERDKQTGEVVDHTEMLHFLAHSNDPLADQQAIFVPLGVEEGTEDGWRVADRLPHRIWRRILGLITAADRASLSLSCHAFQRLMGGAAPLAALALSSSYEEEPEDRRQRLSFLPRLDRRFPRHLLCFDCAVYHLRTQQGEEFLKPANIPNPLYNCPYFSNPQKIYPRIRLTFGRTLPFPFVQLAMRAHRFSPDYGIPVDSLSRRYKDREHVGTWSHQTRFVAVKGHLMMRVISQTFAPPGLPPAGERHLLYSQQENYVPFFSVCPHWRDGVLMPSVKCALRHIPKPLEGSGVNRLAQEIKLHYHPQNPVVSLCTDCRPIRRCPKCPTEYLIEVKMAEDRSDPTKLFKQALVVTRWSDLGDGTSPFTPEWSACCGAEDGYDSFTAIGARAVSGQFEAEINQDTIPLQDLKSLNPEKKSLGEKGHDWY